jgi:fructosamine-3-kinase
VVVFRMVACGFNVEDGVHLNERGKAGTKFLLSFQKSKLFFLNSAIKIKLEEILSKKLSKKVLIMEMIALGGGCINECYKVHTSAGQFFIKVNDGKKFPAMFEAEEKGLRLLGDTFHGIVPEVIACVNEDEMILVLEWVEEAAGAKNFWDDFARKLASIHSRTSENYGLNHDNYMGSLPQSNKEMTDWVSFFILRRIEPQLKKAIDEKAFPKRSTVHLRNSLYGYLKFFLPKNLRCFTVICGLVIL